MLSSRPLSFRDLPWLPMAAPGNPQGPLFQEAREGGSLSQDPRGPPVHVRGGGQAAHGDCASLVLILITLWGWDLASLLPVGSPRLRGGEQAALGCPACELPMSTPVRGTFETQGPRHLSSLGVWRAQLWGPHARAGDPRELSSCLTLCRCPCQSRPGRSVDAPPGRCGPSPA